MRYLLVLGFACDVYRREPRARIFVGDKLIDEFNIQHQENSLHKTNKIFFQGRHILQPYLDTEFVNMQIKNFPPLQFYEVEIDKTINRIELRIEIENSDSNYCNGFMSVSTLIMLKVCYFFPLDKKLLLRLHKIKNKNRLTHNYGWYRVYKNKIFNILHNGLCWQGKNGQIINSDGTEYIESYKLGVDGVFTCELKKKYQILMNKLKKANRYIYDITLLNYFLNKYQQHANQRNNN